MPRLTGPLFSLDARQTLGKTIVYSAWKGLNYARMRVIPYNPKSAYQTGVRNSMTKAVFYWQGSDYVDATAQTWWNTYAEGTNMSGFNRFTKFFMAANYDGDTGTFIYDSIPQPE